MSETVTGAVEKVSNTPSALVRRYSRDFTEVLPSHIKPETWVRLATGALKRGKKVSAPGGGQCTELELAAQNNPPAFMAALLEAARLGLEPGTEQFYLTPRKQRGRLEVLGIVGYQGYIELMYRAGAVSSVVAEVVCERDQFIWKPGQLDTQYPPRWEGPQTIPLHEIDWDADDRGKLKYTYAYARMINGDTSKVVVLNRAAIKKIRDKSQGADSEYSPWQTNEEAMWLKGLSLDTPIPTPAGWTDMASIRVGDLVIDKDGLPSRVVATSPTRNIRCYQLTLRNGRSIVCDEEHLWLAKVGDGSYKVRGVHALYEAKLSGKSVVVPVSLPMELPAANLPVDPYVLGYWLGNGAASRASLTITEASVDEVVTAIRSAGYEVGSVRPCSGCSQVGIRSGLTKKLANLGVLGCKHVPKEYMRGSIEQRRALLAGLMDSDGSVDQAVNRVKFYNTSAVLRDSVAELARSLGEQVTCMQWMASGYGKNVMCYGASWNPRVIPFAVSVKISRTRTRMVDRGHSVTTIAEIDSVPTRCISVDSASSTFLAGVDMVPTHNSSVRQLRKWVPTSPEWLTKQLQAAKAAGVGLPVQNSQGDPLDLTGSQESGGLDDFVDGEVIEDTEWPEVVPPGSGSR